MEKKDLKETYGRKEKIEKEREVLKHQEKIIEMVHSIYNLTFLKKIEDYVELPYMLAKKEQED